MAGSTLTPSRSKYTLTSAELSKQLSTGGGINLCSAIVTGGGSSAVLRIIDSRAGAGEAGPGPNNFIVAANTGESTPFCPTRPVLMEQGLYIELEQGGAQNGEATVFYDPA